MSSMFYGPDDPCLYAGGGGKGDREAYLRDLKKSGIGSYDKWPNASGDWKKEEKSPEEIRHSNATYSPSQVDEDQLVKQPRTSPGKNFDRYDDMPAEIIGSNISAVKMVIDSFEQALWQKPLLRNLKDLGFETPTPIQRYGMPYVMDLRDVVAISPTGSGKTAAYLLPIMDYLWKRHDMEWPHSDHPAPCAIVVVPTHELAEQVKNEARSYARGTKMQIVSTYGRSNWRAQVEYIRRKGCNIVVGTPGRLLQLLSEGRLNLCKCKFIILDEPQVNDNYLAAVKHILDFPGLPKRWDVRNTVMFSATFPKELQKLANKFMFDYVFVSVGKMGANEDITQKVLLVPRSDKCEKLAELLAQECEGYPDAAGSGVGTKLEKTLIFVERGSVAKLVCSKLSQLGFLTAIIYGDREQRDREEAVKNFKFGRCQILVSTAVASRGLDIVGVGHVINFDLPETIDDFVQRIGRTGRLGNTGRATAFYDPQTDKDIAGPLVQLLRDAKQEVPEWLVEESGDAAALAAGGETKE